MIDNFQDQEIQRTQAEHLRTIEGYMRDISSRADRAEVVGQTGVSPYFEQSAVQSTIQQVTGGDHSSSIANLVVDKLQRSVLFAAGAAGAAGGFAGSAAMTYGGAVLGAAGATAPIQGTDRTTGFWGNDPAYSTNYNSTFWSDLQGSINWTRAQQNVYQQDWREMAQVNMGARIGAIATAPLALFGVDPTKYAADAGRIDAFDQHLFRYGRGGSGIGGVGLSMMERVSGAAELEMMAVRDLGATGDQYRFTRDVMAQSGIFMPGQVGGVGHINQMTQQMVLAGQEIAKSTGMSFEDSVGTIAGLRQFGVRGIDQMREIALTTQSMAMTSGLQYGELTGAMQTGAAMFRGTGIDVGVGALMGRDMMNTTANLYYNNVLTENMVRQAGGMQGLSQNLQQQALGFATTTGQMYYMAGGVQGSFGDTISAAGANMGTMQGYADFMANRDVIMSQGGSQAIDRMQRDYLSNVFQMSTGRDFDTGSQADQNMITMLAITSGKYGDENTARAYVRSNFTQEGMASQFESRIAEVAARGSLDIRRRADLAYQERSFAGLMTRTQQRLYDIPIETASRALANVSYGLGSVFTGSYTERLSQRRAMGAAGFGEMTSEDAEAFALGDFSEFGGDLEALNYSPSLGKYAAGMAYGTYEGSGAGWMLAAGIGTAAGAIIGGLTPFGPAGAWLGAKAGFKIGSWIGLKGGGLIGAGVGAYSVADLAFDTGIKDVADYSAFASTWNSNGANVSSDDIKTMVADGSADEIMGMYQRLGGSIDPSDIKNSGKMQDIITKIATDTGKTRGEVSAVLRVEGGVTADVATGREVSMMVNFGKEGIADNVSEIVKGFGVTGWFDDTESMERFLDDTTNVRVAKEFLESVSSMDAAQILKGGNRLIDLMTKSGVDSSAIQRVRDMIDDPLQYIGKDNRRLIDQLGIQEGHLLYGSARERVSGVIATLGEDLKDEQLIRLSKSHSVEDMMSGFLDKMDSKEFQQLVRNNPDFSHLARITDAVMSGETFRSKEGFKQTFGVGISEEALAQYRQMFEDEGGDEVKKRLLQQSILTKGGGSSGLSNKTPEQLLNDAANIFKETGQLLGAKLAE